jgi:hypothetical protein
MYREWRHLPRLDAPHSVEFDGLNVNQNRRIHVQPLIYRKQKTSASDGSKNIRSIFPRVETALPPQSMTNGILQLGRGLSYDRIGTRKIPSTAAIDKEDCMFSGNYRKLEGSRYHATDMKALPSVQAAWLIVI